MNRVILFLANPILMFLSLLLLSGCNTTNRLELMVAGNHEKAIVCVVSEIYDTSKYKLVLSRYLELQRLKQLVDVMPELDNYYIEPVIEYFKIDTLSNEKTGSIELVYNTDLKKDLEVNSVLMNLSPLLKTKNKNQYCMYLESESNGEINKALYLIHYNGNDFTFVKYLDGILFNN